MAHVVDGDEIEKGNGDIYQVQVRKLDGFLELTETNKRITAIKIDVEGHELRVFKGAVELLKKNKPMIFCEIWPNEQREETFEFLIALGYEPNVFENDSWVKYDNQEALNFLFVHKNC